ncbi:hypothetical protein IGI04_019841, partial [Brassica rapa subsp. trilocularis]
MKSKLVVHYLALGFLFTIQLWTERRTLKNISCSRTYSDLHQGFSYIFVAKKRESYKKAKNFRVWKLSVLVGYPLELDIFDLSEDRRKKFEAPRQCKEQLKGRRCEMTDVEDLFSLFLWIIKRNWQIIHKRPTQ